MISALRRSREGAWIEILRNTLPSTGNAVAPVRERGLKFKNQFQIFFHCRRSREGAWIEIGWLLCGHNDNESRSREGAWIEIRAGGDYDAAIYDVAPVRERGLKFEQVLMAEMRTLVAPVRERGLKYLDKYPHCVSTQSLP